jgi:hypothetical protein
MDQDTAAGPVPGRGLPGPVDGTDTGHELEDRGVRHHQRDRRQWVHGIQLLDQDEPGFWESLGYHSYGDPWREQRYWGD